MASKLTDTFERNRRDLLQYDINPDQEADLMIRYTKVFTRELTFSVDLMTFVMMESNLYFENTIYPNCLGRPCASDFDGVMKKLVELTLSRHKTRAANLIEKNINLDNPDYTEFKCFVNNAALKIERLDYGEYMYLFFCIMMSQMCSIAYLHGLTNAPDFGIMLMCRTYSNFAFKGALPPKPWEMINTVARDVVELLEKEPHKVTL